MYELNQFNKQTKQYFYSFTRFIQSYGGDHQCRPRKSSVTDIRISELNTIKRYDECSTVALDISKELDRVWHHKYFGLPIINERYILVVFDRVILGPSP